MSPVVVSAPARVIMYRLIMGGTYKARQRNALTIVGGIQGPNADLPFFRFISKIQSPVARSVSASYSVVIGGHKLSENSLGG